MPRSRLLPRTWSIVQVTGKAAVRVRVYDLSIPHLTFLNLCPFTSSFICFTPFFLPGSKGQKQNPELLRTQKSEVPFRSQNSGL